MTLRRKADCKSTRSKVFAAKYTALLGSAVAVYKDLFGCLGELSWLAGRITLETYASFSPP